MRNLVARVNFVEFRDSRNFTFFEETDVGRHMASHVGDTWQAMCHNAWQRPIHVEHMASHVCDTWHAMCQHAWHMEKALYGVWELFIEGGSNKKEKEGKKK